MLALVVGVKINIIRLQLIMLVTLVAFRAFLHFSIIDTMNSMIDYFFFLFTSFYALNLLRYRAIVIPTDLEFRKHILLSLLVIYSILLVSVVD